MRQGDKRVLERKAGLSLGTILEFKPDGTIVQAAQISATLPRTSKDEAQPGIFKRLIFAASSLSLREAIKDFRGGGDWYTIYKAYEGLKKHYGNEHKLFMVFPEKKTELKRLCRTANSHRHTAAAYKEIANPISLNAAKALIESIFHAIACAEPYPKSPFPNGQVQLDNYAEMSLFSISAPIVKKCS